MAAYKSILYQKAVGFSIRIVTLFKYLMLKEKLYDPLYKQLLRSGTTIGTSISEAQNPKKILFINFQYHKSNPGKLNSGLEY